MGVDGGCRDRVRYIRANGPSASRSRWAGLTGAILVVGLAACGRNEMAQDDLVIAFSPVCKEGEIWLDSSVLNSGKETVVIETGGLPWQYDPIATHFTASASGEALKKEEFYPPIGRVGPVTLEPSQSRSGSTPIEALFPEIKQVLSKQPVTIRWRYLDEFEGEVEIARDPCGP